MSEIAPDQASRWRMLLDALAAHQRLSVAEASELLGVSAATVRRDFTELARQQLATRTHGGVVATSVAYDLPARYRITTDDPRERIAREAALRVEPRSVIAFNGGTTTSAVARHLASRVDLQSGFDAVTIVTNALNIASEMVLRPSIRTVVIGGVARPESYELHGPFASRVLADLLVDQLFLGVDGLTAHEGASCSHLGESGINSEMVGKAQKVTVVAAAGKLGKVTLARICGIDQIQALVTDSSADEKVVAQLRDAGVDVTLV